MVPPARASFGGADGADVDVDAAGVQGDADCDFGGDGDLGGDDDDDCGAGCDEGGRCVHTPVLTSVAQCPQTLLPFAVYARAGDKSPVRHGARVVQISAVFWGGSWVLACCVLACGR